jgi:hypothetical protein
LDWIFKLGDFTGWQNHQVQAGFTNVSTNDHLVWHNCSSERTLQRGPSLRIELGVSGSDPAPSGGGLGSRSRSDLFEGRSNTTILLTDDLEDLGAAGSAVLSPILNLQGAAVRVKNGLEFIFGRVGFVFGHDCLHCEAVLVVYKILAVSERALTSTLKLHWHATKTSLTAPQQAFTMLGPVKSAGVAQR